MPLKDDFPYLGSWDSVGLGILCTVLLLLLYSSRRVPAALVVFGRHRQNVLSLLAGTERRFGRRR